MSSDKIPSSENYALMQLLNEKEQAYNKLKKKYKELEKSFREE